MNTLFKLKHILLFIATSITSYNYSQEMLSPLEQNSNIKNQHINRNIDQTYIYAIDTIHLPFKDDFSKDFFKKYNATPTDANVTDTLFHTILIAGVPDVDTASYMTDTTYRYNITVHPNDSISIDTIALPSTTITYCNLNTYPVICVTTTVWPATVIYDSLHTTISPDFVYPISPANIIQDSAQVYFVAATDTNSLWQDNFVYLNNNYAINPPTIGVVTFDGLNEKGYPYDFSTSTTYGIADYLTSKPIFLGKRANNTPYGIADSLFISFYYQPEGLGDNVGGVEPELEDSLVLQFWSPVNNTWNSVWNTQGISLYDTNFRKDTGFNHVMIPINDNQYFADGFKFRFLNYSSLSGSFDHWNVDYVYLNELRIHSDTIRDDVAFQYPVTSLLKDYKAMPWNHYKWNVLGFMADTIITHQRNNANYGHLVGNNDLTISYQNTLQQTINNPGTPSINGFTNFTTEFDIETSSYKFDTLVNDTCAVFNIKCIHNTTPDKCRFNDTLHFKQIFSDYYAYDDGSAEAAYGVQGLGVINPKIASKFNLSKGDTLKSLKIHFTPSATNQSSSPFIVTIWKEGAGGKPGSILHENITYSTPKYNIGVNGFYNYKLDSNIFIPAGNYFVGFQQTTQPVINVGYDLNNKNNTKTYYNSSGNWHTSSLNGTLMIRPAFAYGKDYIIGIHENYISNLTLYPNPTNGIFHINHDEKITTIQVFDVNGRNIISVTNTNQIDLANFDSGIYFIKITDNKNRINTKKIIKN